MNVLKWLRRLGIVRFGAEAAVYHDATERPLSFQQDDVFDSDADVMFKKAKQTVPDHKQESTEL